MTVMKQLKKSKPIYMKFWAFHAAFDTAHLWRVIAPFFKLWNKPRSTHLCEASQFRHRGRNLSTVPENSGRVGKETMTGKGTKIRRYLGFIQQHQIGIFPRATHAVTVRLEGCCFRKMRHKQTSLGVAAKYGFNIFFHNCRNTLSKQSKSIPRMLK